MAVKKWKKSLQQQLKISPQNINQYRNKLGADSLNVINIMMEVENKFNIEVNEKTLSEFTSVNSIGYKLAIVVN